MLIALLYCPIAIIAAAGLDLENAHFLSTSAARARPPGGEKYNCRAEGLIIMSHRKELYQVRPGVEALEDRLLLSF